MKKGWLYFFCSSLRFFLSFLVLNGVGAEAFGQCTLGTATSQTNILCNGANTGTASVTPTGGTQPYTYNWSTGASTSAISNLPPGSYTSTVIDASCITSGVELVTNGDFSAGNIGFSSTYTACVPNCSEGSYAIGTNPAAVHVAWCPCTDHTSAAGNFMIVNGAANPGTDVWCQTIAVTPNTNYNFSTWVVSQYTVSPALLQFSINGTPLCSQFTAPSTCCVWQQFFCVWNSGPSTSATICILNQNTILSGNDFGLDDISFMSCAPCTLMNTVTITEPTALVTINSQTNVSCNGGADGAATVSISGGVFPYNYLWDNGQTTFSSTGLIAGNYSVTVTDANNCTLTASFTITQPSPISISGNTTNEFCNRSDGTATITAAGGTGIHSYLWTPSAQATATATGLAAANYSVTVSDANGCTHDTVLVVSFTPGPTANAGTDASMCSGNTITLGASGGGTYAWSPSNGLNGATVANPAFSGTVSTTYTVTITDANNCTASDDVLVSVYPSPEISFSATSACFTNPTLFTDNSTGNIVQWSWDFGEPSSGINNTSALQNPTHTYNSPGTFPVTLIAYTAEGCGDTTALNVTVHPLPITSFSSTTVCIGTATNFTDMTTVSPGTITSWSWNFGDPASGAANTSSIQNPGHLFTAVGNFNVLLTVTSGNGCQSSTTIQAVVLFPPIASFTFANSCVNSPAQFTDQSINATNWSWDFGDGGTSNIQHPSHVYTAFGDYIVTLIGSSTGTCSDTITDTVTVYPPPVVNFISDTVCLGDSSSFFNLSYIPSGTITGWHWDFGDGDTSMLQNPGHIYSSSGSFTVTLTATSANGCPAAAAASVYVYPLPTADFSFSPAPTAQLIDEVNFNDLSTGSPVQWWWDFGDGNTSSQQNPSYYYSDTGLFVVTLVVTSADGCVDTAQYSPEIRDFTFYISNSFSPNGDNLNDLFFGKGIGIVEYELIIFDRWGNRVFYCKINDLPQTLPCMWDGKVEGGSSNKYVQEDVYVWKVKLVSTFHQEYNYIGNVNVIR